MLKQKVLNLVTKVMWSHSIINCFKRLNNVCSYRQKRK